MPKATVLDSDEEVRFEKENVKGHRLPSSIGAFPGLFILTNKRVIFESDAKDGFFGPRRPITMLSLALENVFSVTSVEGRLEVNGFQFDVENATSVEAKIKSLVVARKHKIEAAKRRVNLILDFSFLKDYLKKGGLIITTIQCPNCGASTKLPESGNQTICDHCGSTVYAQEIFEKVKKLIG